MGGCRLPPSQPPLHRHGSDFITDPIQAGPRVRVRRWFRLGLRSLMVLVLIVGGGLGWFVRQSHEQRDAVAAIGQAGGHVVYDWDWGSATRREASGGQGRWQGWLINLLGPESVGTIKSVGFSGGKAADALMARVGRFRELAALHLNGSQGVTDAGLAHLRNLTEMRELDLSFTGVQGSGLECLKGMWWLEQLNLIKIPVENQVLIEIAGLRSLEKLDLTGKNLTDAGLAHFKGLTNLKWLQVIGGPLTSAGLVHLQRMTRLEVLSMPRTQVESLQPVAHLKGILSLNLIKTRMDDAGLAPVGVMPGWNPSP